jgi:hypothetical protein
MPTPRFATRAAVPLVAGVAGGRPSSNDTVPWLAEAEIPGYLGAGERLVQLGLGAGRHLIERLASRDLLL